MLYYILFFTLTFLFLYCPIRAEFLKQKEKKFHKDLYLFQLKKVREHYSALQDLTYTEIEETYNVRDAYYSIR